MNDERDNGCLCQGCGRRYKVDVMVPDGEWDWMRPFGTNKGGGLLCGHCIIDRLESCGHNAYKLEEIP